MNNKSAAAKVLEALASAGGGQLDLGALSKLQKGSMAPVQEANSVLRSLHKPHAYMKKACKRCGAVFETNYCSMAYCTDDCLAASMRDIGIVWDPFKMQRHESHMYSSDSNVVWRYEPPETISTQTLNELEPVLRAWLADLDRLRGKAEARETEQLDKMLQGLPEEFHSEPYAQQSPLTSQEVLLESVLPSLPPLDTDSPEEADPLAQPQEEDLDWPFGF